jgi:Cu+-exporting ATPase
MYDCSMTMPGSVLQESVPVCFHCGDTVKHEAVVADDKAFCCHGCKTVYESLLQNNLCASYRFDDAPGRTPSAVSRPQFAWLEEPGIAARLKEFSDGTTASVTFFVPGMHCSSCVWLLEHLHRIDPGILQSRVDFMRKRITVRFTESATSLRKVVELLASLGYEPRLSLASGAGETEVRTDRSLYARVGIAGFCFSNIMLLSFPEYLSGGGIDPGLRWVFPMLSLVLALPVFFYSAGLYFVSAYRGLRRRIVNIDLPIALGIAVLFGRSLAEILMETGPGYLDSMAGLVFFLLIGRVFQSKTYDSLNFERTYTSYFPLAVMVRRASGDQAVTVTELAVGDRILIRHNELVPADAVLMDGEAAIDYSFVTGEALPVVSAAGEVIFAGGRQTGAAIELEVVREVSQSHLTRLWNDSSVREGKHGGLISVSNTVARYFTPGILVLAAIAAAYWIPRNTGTAVDAVIGVLIVACPCALALATPFAYGTALRIFGRNGLYLKHADVVESMARVRSLVFDKTGTLTESGGRRVRFVGNPLLPAEQTAIASVAASSCHPLSRMLSASLAVDETHPPDAFREVAGAGIEGEVGGTVVRLGSPAFAGATGEIDEPAAGESRVVVAMNGRMRGYFSAQSRYRGGVADLMTRLWKRYRLHVLSGDTERERGALEGMVAAGTPLRFRQSPADKKEYVETLQRGGTAVLMVGDGLNDAGALRAADVGIALSDDIAAFSPACDAIIDGRMLSRLDAMLDLSRLSVLFVIGSFAVSLLYNVGVLTIAFRGGLSPIIAAILMPLSSITVVLLAAGSVHWAARRKGLI